MYKMNLPSGLPTLTSERRSTINPGTPPGIEHLIAKREAPQKGEILFSVIDYNKERWEEHQFDDLEEFSSFTKPDWVEVRWINVIGTHPHVLHRFSLDYGIHALAAEDALNVSQRSKNEPYENHNFGVMRMLSMDGNTLLNEQVSFFLLDDILITVQEQEGDVWGSIRTRMQNPNSRFRKLGVGYLFYALLDSIVDHYFPIIEQLTQSLDALEQSIHADQSPNIQKEIHQAQAIILELRRIVTPMREAVYDLYRDDENWFTPEVKQFMRDVYDHTLQVIEAVEVSREMTKSLNDLYLSNVSHRMNEVMKVLTIMASLFIPVTFLAGVYGMNFENIPELSWSYSYPVFWTLCIMITASLVVYFRKKRWL